MDAWCHQFCAWKLPLGAIVERVAAIELDGNPNDSFTTRCAVTKLPLRMTRLH
jgi:hypothetical protein